MNVDPLYNFYALSAIFESINDVLLTHNLQFNILKCIPAFEDVFGYHAEEILYKSVFILVPQKYHSEQNEISPRALRGESITKLWTTRITREGVRIDHFQTTRLSKYGMEIPISLTVSPLKDREGNIIGISNTAHNITNVRIAAKRYEILVTIVESSEDAIISENLDDIISS